MVSQQTCIICGKRKREGRGNFTSWGGMYNPLVFMCFSCMDKLEKEAAKRKKEAFKKQLEEWKQSAPQRPKDEDVLREVLRELCTESGWFKIKDITTAFNVKVGVTASCLHVGNLLARIGFPLKKRRTHNYTYVWIAIPMLDREIQRSSLRL